MPNLTQEQTMNIPAITITLKPGERYAGIALDSNGALSHHLIALPDEVVKVSWDKAMEWAKTTGGELPTRSEQALLYSNLKSEFEQRAYWSAEQHAAYADYACVQYFNDGNQSYDLKSYEGRARAVRRLPI